MRASREPEPRVRASPADETLHRSRNKVRAVEALMRAHVLPLVERNHRAPNAALMTEKSRFFSSREIARFVDSAVAGNGKALSDSVALARQMDVAFEDIWLDLLQPAARVLGVRWATDTCDFATVTLAMCQFHSLLRRYSPLFTSATPGPVLAHRILLTPAADEQHSFGLVMLAEFMRREGCEVVMGPFGSQRGLVSAVRHGWFNVVGFSLSCDAKLTETARQIASVRRASKNPAVAILAGGRVFNDHPEFVSRVGADWTACDAREAVALVRGLTVSAPF